MMRLKRGVLAAWLLGAWLLLGNVGWTAKPESELPEAPNFDAIELRPNGAQEVVTLEDLAGRPLVLYFWTTFCPYCAQDLPALHKAFPDLMSNRPDGPVFLAVDLGESESVVRRHVASRGYTMRVLLDPGSEVGFMYRVVATPTYVFVTSDGKIQARHLGPMPHEAFRKQLEALK